MAAKQKFPHHRHSLSSKPQQDRLLPKIIALLTDHTVGSMERLAEVPQDAESRFQFWYAADKRARVIHRVPCTTAQQSVDEAMNECRRRIAERIEWVALA